VIENHVKVCFARRKYLGKEGRKEGRKEGKEGGRK
jgi:hypothetical protein